MVDAPVATPGAAVDPGPPAPPAPAPAAVEPRPAPWWRRPESLATAVVVLAGTALVLATLSPSLLLTDTTPAGGDMGAHVWGPAFLRDTLLPQGRLAGWAPDWYAGFPAYHFYMVLPSLAIVGLDVALPYGVAFKLVSVSGLLALPAAAWALGRAARVPFPGPALLAVGAVGFLLDRSFTIYGGNVASTLAGEFAFSISLALALAFLALVLRGLETGRHRALAAAALGLCVLCHVIPAIFALVGAAVALALRPSRAGLRWLVPPVVVGAAVSGFWTLPFVARRAYLNDMGWEKRTDFLEGLLPGDAGHALSRLLSGGAGNYAGQSYVGDLTVVAVLALVGAVASLALRRRLGTFLSAVAVLAAVGFLLAPQGRLWNARLLPFWYLCLYLLAALAVAELASALGVLSSRRPSTQRRVAVGATLCAAALVLGLLAAPLRLLPLGDESGDGARYSWLGLDVRDDSFLPDWARWNYSGYERKDAWPEYRELVTTMETVGRDVGCGRAMWEYSPELDRYGTPMAPMLLPYWTGGCIGSMEGLYFEASATTPFHFLNQTELSATPSRAQRDLDYEQLDVAKGVDHLQLLGVRYYLASSETAIDAADAEPDLRPVAETGPWHVYEVAGGADLVAPLSAEPAVVEGAEGGRAWLDAVGAWYQRPTEWDVYLAADGPEAWQRVAPGDEPEDPARSFLEPPETERRPVPEVEVRDVRTRTDEIRFRVDRPGSPVLVRASYFPNWEASGADGPWQVSPNLMVVVPTEEEVVLRYGTTPVDAGAWAVTGLGVLGVAGLALRPPVAMPAPPARRREEAEWEPAGGDEPPAGDAGAPSAPPRF